MSNDANLTAFSHEAILTKLDEGATLPTSITDALVGEAVGYLDAAGETLALGKTATAIKAHQGNADVRTSVTGAITFAFTALENKQLTRELFYGAEQVGSTLTVKAGGAIRGTFVYDTFDTETDVAERYVFSGTITANGDRVFAYESLTTYPLMLTVEGDLTVIVGADAS